MGFVMGIKFTPLEIPEVILVEPQVHKDSRGYFLETYHQKKYEEGGIKTTFVQDNFSYSMKNILRGLHFQLRKPQAKLVTCLNGEIFDVTVDIRPHSPSYGKWVSAHLTGENKNQLFIPAGFAHGFCVLSETAQVHYKCSGYYDPEDERGILWSDPQIGIRWPLDEVILSEKDKSFPLLND
jgi:dTDP-4-dehydrorhamnose 3,5-epimerase